MRGVDYPETWSEFVAWFPNDAACLTYLERLRWPSVSTLSETPTVPKWMSPLRAVRRTFRGGNDEHGGDARGVCALV